MNVPIPAAVAYVRDLLSGFDARWVLCGGWAADSWLGGPTREHGDVDIAVFHRDQRAIFEHFHGWALVGHDPNVPGDTSEQWNGRQLDLPAHIHVPRLGTSLSTSTTVTHPVVEFEFLLNEGSDRDWVLNGELDVVLPLADAVQTSAWGMPTAVPEVILFFKAGGGLTRAELAEATRLYRAHDEQDFLALLPTLTDSQRSWLRSAIRKIHAEHPWLARLES